MHPSPELAREPQDQRPGTGARQVVLFDGVCGLCDRAVQFLLVHDRHAVLTYAPLQGPTAARLLAECGLPEGDLRSMIFVRDEGTPSQRAFVRSAAMLAILRQVGGIWRLVGALTVIPRPLRDLIYNWIARNRYAWWGTLDTCRVPSPEQSARFLP